MKKIIKNVVVVLLILTLSASTAFLAYLHFFASEDEELSGEWIAELDMTEQAAVTALSWLQDIEAVSISLEDMEAYMQDLTIQMNLTLEQTAPSEGTFRCYVLPESYDACKQAAYEAFAEAFRALLTERLLMAGYTGSTDQETIEALVTETFGMSTVSYLMSCGPALLPSLEELQAQYDGSGVYEFAEGVLTRQFDGGGPAAIKVESYIRNDVSLILSEEDGSVSDGFFSDHSPVVYMLKQPQEQ
ncbi:MAG: hypothetical protein HDR21_12970 [Lachnospiraceae bacterium]|nr:hypothetical protein [Lachnospiraceae bacterium]MBD5482144.1 hypothetical protein [Lachnospiraceae bacterium]